MERGDAGNALIETLACQGRQEDLGDVEPAAVLGGVVDLESFDQASSLGRGERFVEARQIMDIEVVHHQNDGRGVSVRFVGQTGQEVRHIDGRTSRGHLDEAASRQRLYSREDVGCPATLVFVIDPGRSTRACGNGSAGVIEQLLAGFIEANLRPIPIIRAMVNVEDVLHALHERGVSLGRNAEALDKPRLRFVFFRPRWTVLGLTESNTFNSTSRSARSEMVHRVRPAGGSLQAI